jgi:hypothetical protein
MRLKISSASKPDITKLVERKDFRGLIKALRNSDVTIQWQAAYALGKMGQEGVDHLLDALSHKNREVKLGAIEALGEIKDPRAVPLLIDLLKDESVEVRWAAAIALGEIGDRRAIQPLVTSLGDADRYARFGAAISLENLHWKPENDTEKAYFLLGKQDWDELGKMGEAAIKPLNQALRDSHVDVRMKVMELIGHIGSEKGIHGMMRGLMDENPSVRWKAVLAGNKCGIPHMYLPRGLSKRPRIRKSPRVAAFLNFILPGLGYDYLGLWFGVPIFQFEVTLTLLLLSYEGENITYTILLPAYAILALHAWYLARKMVEL